MDELGALDLDVVINSLGVISLVGVSLSARGLAGIGNGQLQIGHCNRSNDLHTTCCGVDCGILGGVCS